jgi:hypothetical protein
MIAISSKTTLSLLQSVNQHSFDGTRYVEASNYEGTCFTCFCGENFIDLSDLYEHMRDEMPERQEDGLGNDALQNLLAAAYSTLLISVR